MITFICGVFVGIGVLGFFLCVEPNKVISVFCRNSTISSLHKCVFQDKETPLFSTARRRNTVQPQGYSAQSTGPVGGVRIEGSPNIPDDGNPDYSFPIEDDPFDLSQLKNK